MDRNEGGAATSTRGRGETAIAQWRSSHRRGRSRCERKRRAPKLRDGGFKTPMIVGILKPPSRESHLPPLDVTPKSMASRTRRTSPRSRSSSERAMHAHLSRCGQALRRSCRAHAIRVRRSLTAAPCKKQSAFQGPFSPLGGRATSTASRELLEQWRTAPTARIRSSTPGCVCERSDMLGEGVDRGGY
jgi:hypothetical protein